SPCWCCMSCPCWSTRRTRAGTTKKTIRPARRCKNPSELFPPVRSRNSRDRHGHAASSGQRATHLFVRQTGMKKEPSAMLSPQPSVTGALQAAQQPRLAIEAIQPVVEGGRFASKCLVHKPVKVGAVIFADGHEQLAADLLWRTDSEAGWQ